MSNVSDKSFIYRSYPKLAYGSIYFKSLLSTELSLITRNTNRAISTVVVTSSVYFQPAPSAEMWQWVHSFYGEELGLTSDDEPDYVSPFGITPSSSALLVSFCTIKVQ